jgi:hypothetical protein
MSKILKVTKKQGFQQIREADGQRKARHEDLRVLGMSEHKITKPAKSGDG